MTDISSMTFWGLPSFVILVSLYVSSVLFPLRFFLRSSPAWLSLLISPALLPDLQSAVPTYLNSVNPSPTSSVCHFPDLCFPASHPLISLVCILSPVICSVIVEPSVQFPLSCCWVPPPPPVGVCLAFGSSPFPGLDPFCFCSWIVEFLLSAFFPSIFGFQLHFIKTRLSFSCLSACFSCIWVHLPCFTVTHLVSTVLKTFSWWQNSLAFVF